MSGATADKVTTDKSTPLVLIHGWAGGVGMWAKNIDELAKGRRVYMLDLMGFGISSRPSMVELTAQQVPEKYLGWIENWMSKLNISECILVGHSFGGFLSTHFTLKHPDQ